MDWPDWWSWELEITPHVEKRMEDRDSTEVELRGMLSAATGFHPDVVEGRFVIESRLGRRAWEVVVEPDDAAQLVAIITAYPVGV